MTMVRVERFTKASATTGRTCWVIVRVLRVFPVVAPVAGRSVKNRYGIEVNASVL